MRIALVLVVSLWVAACRTPGPVYAPLPFEDRRAEALLRRWSEDVTGRQALHAAARLAVDGSRRGGVRLRVRQMLWLSRPNRLRVEIQSPLRTTLGVLVTDGLQYSVDTADGAREMGSVHDALLWEVARLDLTPSQAVDVILGFPGVGEGLLPGRSYQAADGRMRLDLHEPGGALARQLEFDLEGRLARVETPASEDVAQVVEFSDYTPVDGGPFAHRVSIHGADSHATLELSLVELNPVLPPDTFRVDSRLSGEGG